MLQYYEEKKIVEEKFSITNFLLCFFVATLLYRHFIYPQSHFQHECFLNPLKKNVITKKIK